MLHKNRRDIPVVTLGLVLVAALFATPSAARSEGPAAAPADVANADAGAILDVSAAPLSDAASAFDVASWQDAVTGGIEPKVLATALAAAGAAVQRGDAASPATLTVIDFSRPSTEPRLWVYDLRARALLFEELVSHGRGSGRTFSTAFSNQPESHKSSLGLFRAAESYIGKHGYSLRLDGLEPGINDRARDRAIVIHAADYVNAAAARAQGFLGRSLGCPAVRPEISRALIDTVKEGGLVFAYSPDPAFLGASKYL
jgi:hypothetical protein